MTTARNNRTTCVGVYVVICMQKVIAGHGQYAISLSTKTALALTWRVQLRIDEQKEEPDKTLALTNTVQIWPLSREEDPDVCRVHRCKMGRLEVHPAKPDPYYIWEMINVDTESVYVHFDVSNIYPP